MDLYFTHPLTLVHYKFLHLGVFEIWFVWVLVHIIQVYKPLCNRTDLETCFVIFERYQTLLKLTESYCQVEKLFSLACVLFSKVKTFWVKYTIYRSTSTSTLSTYISWK